MTQEIRILAQITLAVPVGLSKKELNERFNNKSIRILTSTIMYESRLEIIDIETEEEIYGTDIP